MLFSMRMSSNVSFVSKKNKFRYARLGDLSETRPRGRPISEQDQISSSVNDTTWLEAANQNRGHSHSVREIIILNRQRILPFFLRWWVKGRNSCKGRAWFVGITFFLWFQKRDNICVDCLERWREVRYLATSHVGRYTIGSNALYLFCID